MSHGELTAWPEVAPDVLDLDHAALCDACNATDSTTDVECGECGYTGPGMITAHTYTFTDAHCPVCGTTHRYDNHPELEHS